MKLPFFQVAFPGLKWKTADVPAERIQLEPSASRVDSVPAELLAIVWYVFCPCI